MVVSHLLPQVDYILADVHTKMSELSRYSDQPRLVSGTAAPGLVSATGAKGSNHWLAGSDESEVDTETYGDTSISAVAPFSMSPRERKRRQIMAKLARGLVDLALEKHTTDNVTVMIVFLQVCSLCICANSLSVLMCLFIFSFDISGSHKTVCPPVHGY